MGGGRAIAETRPRKREGEEREGKGGKTEFGRYNPGAYNCDQAEQRPVISLQNHGFPSIALTPSLSHSPAPGSHMR